MLVFFRRVAEAIAAKGVKGLVEAMLPGGGYIYDVAEDALKRFRERRQEAALRQELLSVAQASLAEARAAAEQAVRDAGLSGEQAAPVAQYLASVPLSVRQSLKRPDDPAGRSVPPAFVLRGADDVVRLLPPAAPRFKPGGRPRGVPRLREAPPPGVQSGHRVTGAAGGAGGGPGRLFLSHLSHRRGNLG